MGPVVLSQPRVVDATSLHQTKTKSKINNTLYIFAMTKSSCTLFTPIDNARFTLRRLVHTHSLDVATSRRAPWAATATGRPPNHHHRRQSPHLGRLTCCTAKPFVSTRACPRHSSKSTRRHRRKNDTLAPTRNAASPVASSPKTRTRRAVNLGCLR